MCFMRPTTDGRRTVTIRRDPILRYSIERWSEYPITEIDTRSDPYSIYVIFIFLLYRKVFAGFLWPFVVNDTREPEGNLPT